MDGLLTPDGMRRAADEFRATYQPGLLLGMLVAGSGLQLEVPGWEIGEEVDLQSVFGFQIH